MLRRCWVLGGFQLLRQARGLVANPCLVRKSSTGFTADRFATTSGGSTVVRVWLTTPMAIFLSVLYLAKPQMAWPIQ